MSADHPGWVIRGPGQDMAPNGPTLLTGWILGPAVVVEIVLGVGLAGDGIGVVSWASPRPGEGGSPLRG
jgi:hypothetical protein